MVGLKSSNIYSHHTLNPKMMSNSSGPSMVYFNDSEKQKYNYQLNFDVTF